MSNNQSTSEVCARKVRFASMTAAKRSRRAGKDRPHPYICPFCKGWHMGGGDMGKRNHALTHQARERRKKIAAARMNEAAEIR